MMNDPMRILEWSVIVIGGITSVGFMIAAVRILYKMKTSKDGFWRP